ELFDPPTPSRRPPSPSTEKSKSRPATPTPSRGIVRTNPVPPGTPRALYDPAELEEDVDIDLERRRQILDTYYRLEALTFYELLGVAADVDKKVIRTAYFELSKVFHPDTKFRKRLGSYKTKMEQIFKRCTEAYEVLGKKARRDEYDAYLKITAATREAQARLRDGEEAARERERAAETLAANAVVVPTAPAPLHMVGEPIPETEPAAHAEQAAREEPPAAAARSERQPPPPAAGPEAPRGRPATPPRDQPAVRDDVDTRRRRAQELYSRRLAGATGRAVGEAPRPPPPLEPPGPKTSPGRDTLVRGLATSLKRAAQLTGGFDQAARYLAEAKRAEEHDDLVAAANALRMALALAPNRLELEEEHERIRQKLAHSLAESYEAQARYEEKAGLWQAAALSWSKVAEGRPSDWVAARQGALAIMQAGADLRSAQKLAQRAVELQPSDAESRRVLGQIYASLGLQLNARRELEAAAALDPADEMVKNLLRDLKA
ncbi:MAG TPA: J domain-containing protein, partial [Myxococcota bacterium]|nr:J domain-containing protein [Myxococcota bacterium]